MFKNNSKTLFIIYFIFLCLIQFSYQFNLFNFYQINFNMNDLKWSGSKLFLQDLNVYEIYIHNKFDPRIKFSQYPNYSILSIYFHLPIGLFDWNKVAIVWRIFSILLMSHIFIILINANLKIKDQNLVIFFSMLLLIFSKPFQILINNGNFSIVCFWAFIFYFFGKKNNIFISLLISSIKYSFAPIIFLHSFLNKNYLNIFLVIFLSLIALIHFSIKFDVNFIETMISPLKIGATSTASGYLDLQTFLGNHPNNSILRYLIIILISILLFLFLFKNSNRSQLFDLCIVTFVTLLLFKHLYYDMVFLLPFLIYSFKIDNKIKYLPIIIIIYFWFISYNEYFLEIRYWKSFLIFNNFALITVFYTLFKFHSKYNA